MYVPGAAIKIRNWCATQKVKLLWRRHWIRTEILGLWKMRKEENIKYIGSMQKEKEYTFSHPSLWGIQLWFAAIWKVTEANLTRTPFSSRLQQKEALSPTQYCTAPEMPLLPFMKLHDEWDWSQFLKDKHLKNVVIFNPNQFPKLTCHTV